MTALPNDYDSDPGRFLSAGKHPHDDVHPYVDLSGLGEGEYTLVVHADTPDHAGVTRVDPAMVQVRISSVKN